MKFAKKAKIKIKFQKMKSGQLFLIEKSPTATGMYRNGKEPKNFVLSQSLKIQIQNHCRFDADALKVGLLIERKLRLHILNEKISEIEGFFKLCIKIF